MIRWTVVLILAVHLLGPLASADAPSDLARQSAQAFQEGAELLKADRAQALARLEESVRFLQMLRTEHGIENSAIHFNIANAYALSERYGRAIEHYLLAQRLNPADRELANNLDYVRSRVPDRLGPPIVRSRTRQILDSLGSGVRLGLFIAAFAGAWGVLMFRAVISDRVQRETSTLDLDEGRLPRVPLWPAALVGAIALLIGATLALDLALPGPTLGVVVDAPTVARQGPSEAAYDAAFTRPVNPGVEFRVLEIRDGLDTPGEWVLAEFGDRRRAWFRRNSVALIDPR